MSNKKLVIIDEMLTTKSGHYYTYNKSVLQSFAPHNYHAVVYANEDVLPEIQTELSAVPYFRFSQKPWYRSLPVLGAILYRMQFWQKLSAQYDAIFAKEGQNALYFFPNLFWYNLPAIARSAAKHDAQISVLIRTSIVKFLNEPKVFQPLLAVLCKSNLAKLAAKSNVHITTDTDLIAQQFDALQLGKKCTILPIPHVEDSPVKPIGNNAMVSLYAPGVMRLEKGARFLAEGLQVFCSQYEDLAQLTEVHTQFFGPAEKDQLDAIKDTISALPLRHHVLGSLSSAEYNSTFYNCDIIIITYVPECGYDARTSGVLAEAIAAGKPFITTDNTWMSRQAAAYGVGRSVPHGDAQAFAEALAYVIKHYDAEVQKVLAAKPAWMAFHSKDNFYKLYTMAQQ